MSIEIIDNGSGIPYDNLKSTFGAFLSSIKNDSSIRIKSQAHKGKGRFSYLCFSYSAEWTTVFKQNGLFKKYNIKTNSANRSNFATTDVIQDELSQSTGTTVEFPLLDANIADQLSYPNMRQKFLEEFAWFIYLNNNKNLKKFLNHHVRFFISLSAAICAFFHLV